MMVSAAKHLDTTCQIWNVPNIPLLNKEIRICIQRERLKSN